MRRQRQENPGMDQRMILTIIVLIASVSVESLYEGIQTDETAMDLAIKMDSNNCFGTTKGNDCPKLL